MAIAVSSSQLRYLFAVRTISDCKQFPAVVVEQEIPPAFKAQLLTLVYVTCPKSSN